MTDQSIRRNTEDEKAIKKQLHRVTNTQSKGFQSTESLSIAHSGREEFIIQISHLTGTDRFMFSHIAFKRHIADKQIVYFFQKGRVTQKLLTKFWSGFLTEENIEALEKVGYLFQNGASPTFIRTEANAWSHIFHLPQ